MRAIDMEPNELKLVQTCDYCPEQYDVFHGNERVGYIRYRSGRFTCQPVIDGKLLNIYLIERTDESWGSIPDDEREEWLNECKNALADFWSNIISSLVEALNRTEGGNQ